MTSLPLHKEHGVNPTIEQTQCPVCGKIFETGSLLLLGRNRGRKADMHTVTKLDLCPKDKKLFDDGYIALVGIDPDKSEIINGLAKPEEAHRTGMLVHVRRSVFKELFNVKDDGLAFMYVENEVIEGLSKIPVKEEKK